MTLITAHMNFHIGLLPALRAQIRQLCAFHGRRHSHRVSENKGLSALPKCSAELKFAGKEQTSHPQSIKVVISVPFSGRAWCQHSHLWKQYALILSRHPCTVRWWGQGVAGKAWKEFAPCQDSPLEHEGELDS